MSDHDCTCGSDWCPRCLRQRCRELEAALHPFAYLLEELGRHPEWDTEMADDTTPLELGGTTIGLTLSDLRAAALALKR